MPKIIPTILSETPEDFKARIDRVAPFARELHIDVADGVFVPTRTVGLSQVYVPEGVSMRLHLMVTRPAGQMEHILSLQPALVIAHFECDDDLEAFFKELRSYGICAGLAIGPETTVAQVRHLLPAIDHVLVFTGTLGHNGGEFHAEALEKIGQAKEVNPELEVSVDGGINQETARLALAAGADVLVAGSFIHNADDPEIAYVALQAIAEELS